MPLHKTGPPAAKPPVLDVLEHYGCPLPPRPKAGGWSPCRCPFPGHEDKWPSASVNVGTDRVMCHPCDRNEDSFGLIMLFEACTYPEAVRISETNWGTDSVRGRVKAPKTKKTRGLW